jgi:hypothetical protein
MLQLCRRQQRVELPLCGVVALVLAASCLRVYDWLCVLNVCCASVCC